MAVKESSKSQTEITKKEAIRGVNFFVEREKMDHCNGDKPQVQQDCI